MASMGRYCKAYYVQRLRECPAWQPDLGQLRPDITEVEGQDVETIRTELKDDDVLYLQESLAVTDGIFLDEHVVFAGASPEWQAFCRTELAFEIPADILEEGIPPEVLSEAEELPTTEISV